MQEILQWDTALFFWINLADLPDWISEFVVLSRNKLTWIPLYVFLLAYMIFNFDRKAMIKGLALIALTLVLSDTLSSKVIKPWVGRDRPCNQFSIQNQVDLKVRCGSGKSFTSSHATNHFGLALVFFFLFKDWGRWRYLFFLWAGLIAFAQVYVGVHYPLDVTAGAILGMSIAATGLVITRWLLGRMTLPVDRA